MVYGYEYPTSRHVLGEAKVILFHKNQPSDPVYLQFERPPFRPSEHGGHPAEIRRGGSIENTREAPRHFYPTRRTAGPEQCDLTNALTTAAVRCAPTGTASHCN